MDRQPVLEGELLLLRPLHPDDWEAVFAVASDPLIWQLHPAHDRWQEAVVRPFFDDALEKRGALVIIDRASGAIVGSSRFQGHDPEESCVEIGWTFLARSHWGGQHNRELKRLMLVHAFRFVERVVFMVGAENLRSRGAMTKIGGKLTDHVEVRKMAGGDMKHVQYVIAVGDYHAGPLAR